MNYLISFYILFSVFLCLIKKKDAFASFSNGVNEGIKISLKMFKVLFCFTILIECINKCGIIEDVSNMIDSSFSKIILGMLIRPFSSSSSMALMLDCFSVYDVDSIPSIVLSLIYSCSDASVYVFVLYFTYLELDIKGIIKYGVLVNLISYILIMIIVFIFIF